MPLDDVTTNRLGLSEGKRCRHEVFSADAWWCYRLKSRRRSPPFAADSILEKTKSEGCWG